MCVISPMQLLCIAFSSTFSVDFKSCKNTHVFRALSKADVCRLVIIWCSNTNTQPNFHTPLPVWGLCLICVMSKHICTTTAGSMLSISEIWLYCMLEVSSGVKATILILSAEVICAWKITHRCVTSLRWL